MARKTKNRRKTIVNALGKDNLQKIYKLADVQHSDNIDDVSDEFIEKVDIQNGNFDNVNDKIDDYNSSFYYDAPQNILNAFIYGEIAVKLNITPAALSYHLKLLKKTDMVMEYKYKNFIYYELNTTVFNELIIWMKQFGGEEE